MRLFVRCVALWLVLVLLFCFVSFILAEEPPDPINDIIEESSGGAKILHGGQLASREGHVRLPLPQHLASLGTLLGKPERIELRPEDPLPVHQDYSRVHFHNTPISKYRPRSFYRPPVPQEESPIITILTSTVNPRPVFLETREFVFNMSIQAFRWVIVNDHSDSPEAYQMLVQTAAMDSRVQLVNNTDDRGVVRARNKALSLVTTPYYAFLDDDDMWEFVGHEKCVWMLETNPNLDICGVRLLGHGMANVIFPMPIQTGIPAEMEATPFLYNLVVRSSVLLSTGCRYDPIFNGGGEDLDFWLCLAGKGHWGATIPEYQFWYRLNPPAMREERWPLLYSEGVAKLQKLTLERHGRIPQVHNMLDPFVHKTTINSPLRFHQPFHNLLLNRKPEKSVLIVLPWAIMPVEETASMDVAFVRLVRHLYMEGYRVTIAFTYYQSLDSIQLLPHFLQYTHDVFTLPIFLRLADVPRFLVYLANSRQVSTMLFFGPQMMYDLLPALRIMLPNVAFVDWLHAEASGWKGGGYPIMSVINRGYLDRTIVTSNRLKDYLIQRGVDEEKVGVVYPGVEADEEVPLNPQQKQQQRERLDLDDAVIVTTVAPLFEDRRPLLGVDAVVKVARDVASTSSVKVRYIIIGDGAMLDATRAHVKAIGAEDLVEVVGQQQPNVTRLLLAVSDIFLLPSRSEQTTSVAVQAMSLGLPVVTTRSGTVEELFGPDDDYGFAIPSSSNQDLKMQRYVDALQQLVLSSALRSKMGQRARDRVVQRFDSKKTLGQVGTQFNAAIEQRLRQDLLEGKADHRHVERDNKVVAEALPSLHQAINNVVSEYPVIADYYHVFMGSTNVTNWPYIGAIILSVCHPPSTPDELEWMAKITGAGSTPCNVGFYNRELIKSVEEWKQCYSRCIFSAFSPERRGWKWTGSCFQPFENEDCA